jgi:alpha-tubulin suppressor-like RCC1 family protein
MRAGSCGTAGRAARAPRARAWLAAVALALACSDSLVDHRAGFEVLNPSGCGAGEVACGSLCVPEDAGHCGPTCASCAGAVPPDPNAGPVCTAAHACGFACNPGWLRVGDACERATAVSAGWRHTCAVTAGGRVKCWGANEHGQLGDGTTADSALPVEAALPAGAVATAIAAGYVHTCAVAGGAVYCWGDNATGSLGDGTTTQRTSPVRVGGGIANATAVSAGGGENVGTPPTFYGHSCALRADGTISCWGSNESGQLGNSSFVQSALPVDVALPSGGVATAVSNGDRHTCAVISGGAWCWGRADFGQLGTGTTTNQSRPQRAVQNGVSAVAAGAAHSCAVIAAPAALQCWGSNAFGQAGGGVSSGDVLQPVSVTLPGVTPAAPVAAGGAHTCVADGVSGAATCFGAGAQSQLSGPGTPTGKVRVPLADAVKELTAGYSHGCALLVNQAVQCWGANGRGQVGIGTVSAAVEAPTFVSGQ